MTDIVLVALIGLLSTLGAVFITQLFNAKESTRRAQIAERQEREGWLRDKANDQAKSKSDQLQKFLALILLSRARLIEQTEEMYRKEAQSGLSALNLKDFSASPAASASEAYAIALLSLPELRVLAKDFYQTSAKLQLAIEAFDAKQAEKIGKASCRERVCK